jgi:hypothetical protein
VHRNVKFRLCQLLSIDKIENILCIAKKI